MTAILTTNFGFKKTLTKKSARNITIISYSKPLLKSFEVTYIIIPYQRHLTEISDSNLISTGKSVLINLTRIQ